MSNEIQADFATGAQLYCQVFNRTSGYVWNGSAFEAYNSLSGHLATYPVTLTELGTASKHYAGNFPASIGPGTYDLRALQKLTTAYLEADPVVANGSYDWNGSALVPLSDLATSGQVGQGFPLRLAYGVMVQNWPIYLKSAADNVTPFTSGIVSGQISRDNAFFGPLQSGAFTEIGLGHYNLQALTSGDLAGGTVRLSFAATGISGGASAVLPQTILTQHSSGH